MLLHFVDDNSYRFSFPDASNFEDQWKTATTGSSENNLIQGYLRSIFDWIDVAQEFGEDPRAKIWGIIDDCDVDSSALLAAGAAAEWEENEGRTGYNNARSTIRLLDEAVEDARDRDWDSVSVYCFQKMIEFVDKIDSVSESDLARAAEIMKTVTSTADVHLDNLTNLVQIFIDNDVVFTTDKESGMQAFVICISEANKLREQGAFFQERDLLKIMLELSSSLDMESAGLKRRYTDTYWNNADYQSTRGSGLEASELASGLQDNVVMDTLSDEEKRDWKQRIQSSVKSAAHELKRSGVSLDTPRQRRSHEQLVDLLVGNFIRVKYAYDTEAALVWLLTNNEFMPEYTREEDDISIMEIVSTTSYSMSGHLINFDPTDADISSFYTLTASIANSTLVSVLDTLIQRGEFHETDVYSLLNWLLDFDSNQLWYLTLFVTNVFEGRNAEAIHLGVPRIEALLYSLLLKEGEDTDALMDDGTGTRTLGSLLPKMEGYVPENFRQYLRFAYNEPIGQLFGGNMRNRVAHGLLLPGENNRFNSLLILADILRILIFMNTTHIVAKNGLPTVIPIQVEPSSILFRFTNDGVFSLVVGANRSAQMPDEDKIVEYLEKCEQTVSGISNEFNTPYHSTLSQVRVLEALDIVSLNPRTEQVRLNYEEKPRQVRVDSSRGRIADVLATNGWMDCNDVAEETGMDAASTSSILSDTYRTKYTRRRGTNESNGPQYEYKLKDSVELIS